MQGENTPKKTKKTKKKRDGGEGERNKNKDRQGPGYPGPGSTKSQRQRGREREGGKKGEKTREKKQEKKNTRSADNPSLEGSEQRRRTKRPQDKLGRTRMRPRGQPARHSQEEHAHTHARDPGIASSTRKGSCRRPHKTAPVHRPSPRSKDGRYRKPDASVIGSTHPKPPQRTQPETEAGGTRQGQPHRGAPNGYDAERAQRPCLGRGQRQGQ